MKYWTIFLLSVVVGMNLYGMQTGSGEKRNISPLTDAVPVSMHTQPTHSKPFKLTAELLEQLQNELNQTELNPSLEHLKQTFASLLVPDHINAGEKRRILLLFLKNKKFVESHTCDEQVKTMFHGQEVAIRAIEECQQNLQIAQQDSNVQQNLKAEMAKFYTWAHCRGIMCQYAIKKIK